MFLHSVSMYPAHLKRLSVVAAKAGTGSLPVSRSAVRRLLEPGPPAERGGGPFVVEVALTPAQKEQIRRATGNVFASLLIGPHDFPVTYREAWDDAAPVRVGRTLVIKPAGGSHEASRTDRVVELPAGAAAPGGACSAPGATRRRN